MQSSSSSLSLSKSNHQQIAFRNFLALFVCISFLIFIHIQLQPIVTPLETNSKFIKAIINNDVYNDEYINDENIEIMTEYFRGTNYSQLSPGECMSKAFLTIRTNFQYSQGSASQGSSMMGSRRLNFAEGKDYRHLESCLDVLNVLNYQTDGLLDLVYSNQVQERYGYFADSEDLQLQQKTQMDDSKNQQNGFCLMVNQHNTAMTTLRPHLRSILGQQYSNYRMVVLDNGSSDGSYEIAKITLEDEAQKQIKILEAILNKKANSESLQKQMKEKYQVIKNDKRLTEWELIRKYEDRCEGMQYMVFIDGRDLLMSRNVLNILNNVINNRSAEGSVSPSVITSSILIENTFTKYLPSSKDSPYNFTVLSMEFYNSIKEGVLKETQLFRYPFQIREKMHQIFSSEINKVGSSAKSTQIDEMLLAYNIHGRDREPYFISVQKAQRAKAAALKK